MTAAVQVPTIKPFDETDLSDEALAHGEYIFNKAVGPSPKISCKVNGVEVKALADTGSEVITITKSLYLKNFQSQIEDTTYWSHMTQLTGLTKCLGCLHDLESLKLLQVC